MFIIDERWVVVSLKTKEPKFLKRSSDVGFSGVRLRGTDCSPPCFQSVIFRLHSLFRRWGKYPWIL